jgi:predicted DsbA family dithiol-disulfide isomerase
LGIALPSSLALPDRAPADQSVSPSFDDYVTASAALKIIEFVDFECPFCREQYAILADILPDYRERVEVVYKHLPLPIHTQAAHAALVACCADAQGHGEAVVDALFQADDLSPERCRQCAVEAGVDGAELDRCLRSDVPRARLRADEAAAHSVGIRRLPTCFIGQQRFEGSQSEASLRAAIEHALSES